MTERRESLDVPHRLSGSHSDEGRGRGQLNALRRCLQCASKHPGTGKGRGNNRRLTMTQLTTNLTLLGVGEGVGVGDAGRDDVLGQLCWMSEGISW